MLVEVEQGQGNCFHAGVKGQCNKLNHLKSEIFQKSLPFLDQDDFYLEHNGRKLFEDDQVEALFRENDEIKRINVIPRLRGGKGGFGSMLRAIGAQIEKTTNRDACRDLSGRRLRDINEEQRLKKWFARQAEREVEKKEAKKRKLDRLRQVADGPPLPKIDDQDFLQQREDIVDAVFEAVDEAFREDSKVVEELASTDSKSPSSSDTESSRTETETERSASSIIPHSDTLATASSSSYASKQERKPIKRTMFDEDLDSESDGSSSSDDEAEPSSKKVRLP